LFYIYFNIAELNKVIASLFIITHLSRCNWLYDSHFKNGENPKVLSGRLRASNGPIGSTNIQLGVKWSQLNEVSLYDDNKKTLPTNMKKGW